MKKNFIDKIHFGLWLLLMVTFLACKTKEGAHTHTEGNQYTCPMHPQIVKEGPGQCPMCGMDLVPKTTGGHQAVDKELLPLLKPSNAQIAANLSTITAEGGTRIFSVPVQGVVGFDTRRQTSISSRVSGRIEKVYIKYNYQPVRKGQLIMEVYSPDLAAAQRELIYLSKNEHNSSLLQKAKQKLLLLGMQPAQIEKVLKTGQPLYRVPVYSAVSGYIVDQTSLSAAPSASTPMATSGTASGGEMGMNGMGEATASAPAPAAPQMTNSPVMVREGQYVSAGQTVFSLYQSSGLVADFYVDPSLAAHIKRGQRLTYSLVGNKEEVSAGTIGLIEPVQRSGAPFITARVYASGSALQPGQLLAGRIPIVARGWWLPETAVVGLGNRTIVFKKEKEVFVPRNIPAGIRMQGLVQILDSVAHWQVAKHASYLVGGESFIRTSENE